MDSWPKPQFSRNVRASHARWLVRQSRGWLQVVVFGMGGQGWTQLAKETPGVHALLVRNPRRHLPQVQAKQEDGDNQATQKRDQVVRKPSKSVSRETATQDDGKDSNRQNHQGDVNRVRNPAQNIFWVMHARSGPFTQQDAGQKPEATHVKKVQQWSQPDVSADVLSRGFCKRPQQRIIGRPPS